MTLTEFILGVETQTEDERLRKQALQERAQQIALQK